MPITKGAKKAIRVSSKKKLFNLKKKDTMKDAIKNFKKLVSEKKKDEASKLISVTYKAIDKAAKRGVIKKNTASRKKSGIARLLKTIA
ncbi:MAG: 30S ribosomal protein S20 [Candidatus Terrybacteria bacterium CG10_big_fil_rev_8_21_14_0_10_41_10]|uniref:Small ribosomal subunit protein bS20 n=1 Tax=Candidatus Terrybacteria bacterium CG10_big_fil_rev_8_21_14_0_10_41_10 TaxID=1975026 RepID=A0A2M8LC12_9BACT|nr:MAG: 30S ribosomal protein S20 [Candidatus Terrybacteria bacterium CG10_big_fil_rev_8_21_14_0_10_41_10]